MRARPEFILVKLLASAAIVFALTISLIFTIATIVGLTFGLIGGSGPPPTIFDALAILLLYFVTPIAVITLLAISLTAIVSQEGIRFATPLFAAIASILLAASWLFHAYPWAAVLFSILAFGLSISRIHRLLRQSKALRLDLGASTLP